LGPWYTPRTFMHKKAKWFSEGGLAELPSNQDIRASQEILGWEMNPGDVVIFNMLTVHGSKGIPINQRRRSFFAIYGG
jgi:ectoine hydroxylase-related dioxygenase (phytanoyl-CoA dioxygenase family)